jgi:hypothetical protein
MKKLIPITAALLALTACGSSSFDSSEAVAKAAKCENFTPDTEGELFAADSGSCTIDGTEVYIHWFKNDETLKNYRTIADQMSGSRILYGSNFAIECDTKDACETLKKAVGGEIG